MPSPNAADIIARIERLPPTRYVWTLVLLLSLGAYFEIYDMLMTAYVSPGLIQAGIFAEGAHAAFGLSDQAAFASSTFAGLFLGTIGFGWVTDRFGRRAIFTFALLWYAAATLIMGLQDSAGAIFFWRFVAGLGLGVEMITIDTYIAELINRRVRASAFALSQGTMFLAVPSVAFLAWLLVPLQPFGVAGWRWVVFFPVGGALLVWWIRRAIPESPRWLARHGKLDQAEAVLAAMEARIEREYGQPLPRPDPAAFEVGTERGRFADLFRAPYRKRTLLLATFNFFQTIGFYGFGNWVPKLVAAQGVSITSSMLYSAMIALAFPAGPLLFSLFANRFELKWQTVAAALGTACFGLFFTTVHAPWAIIALGIAITLSNNLLSFSYHAYQAEIFLTQIRARGVGFVYSFSRLSTIFTSFVIGWLSAGFGNPGVFAFIAVSMALAAAAIAACPPTRGRSLEELGGS